MVKIAIFASGSGTNFENIVNCISNGTITNASVALLIVDKENCFAIERSKNLNIPYCYVNPKAFINKAEYEKQILIKLKEFNIEILSITKKLHSPIELITGITTFCAATIIGEFSDFPKLSH
ncbi:MAG: formyltransferase family protein, partial [Erysipelotrichaceae bacterium]